MTTATPTTQRRLMALLTGAIYAIANSLFPLIDTVMQQTDRPWVKRALYADRFSRIIMHLLGLSARIRQNSLSRSPTFDTTPQPPPTATKTAAAKQPATIRAPGSLRAAPLRPASLLSPLQFARRLAILLRQLEKLVAEIGAALPANIHRNIARARTIAGCHTLPLPTNPHQTWERAG